MAWNLSTGFKKALLQKSPESLENPYINDDLTFATNTITAATAGAFADIEDDHFILVLRHGGGGNNNTLAQVVSRTDTVLTFAANTFTAESSGTAHAIVAIKAGSVASILQNGVIRLFTGSRPTNADQAESGTLLVEITKDGASFTPGSPTNGLNVGDFDGTTLKRLTDPSTGAKEEWKGTASATGTAGWGRWYDNSRVTGNSSDAIRLDGTVTTSSGGDIVMAGGRDITSGGTVTITEVSATQSGV